jgi:hypothetical protein
MMRDIANWRAAFIRKRRGKNESLLLHLQALKQRKFRLLAAISITPNIFSFFKMIPLLPNRGGGVEARSSSS